MKVPELAKKAHLAPTTLYDLERGDSDSTTKLHLIAAALQINVHWLETGRGEPESDVASTSGEGDGWPFKFDRSRYDDLEPQQRAIIESAVLAMVDQMEAPRSIKKKKAL